MNLRVHPTHPQGRHIRRAVEVLTAGGVIIYPTDTVYGIGCSIFNTKAVERIYQIKQQDRTKPFSFVCSDLSNISEYAKVSNSAYRFMKQLIPGPYTFILPASRLKQLPKSMISKRKTVGIRVPNNPICQAIVKELGHPILNASLVDERREIIIDPEIVREQFERRVDLILEGGNSLQEFSTVLDLTDEQPIVVREGAGDVSTLIAA
ncbi:MAG: threonylcarbamoyl-AMP synthase [Ignavibacteriae bacterium]|nr:threonylcarbamoyl-AMP synthase [Ignavibacteria bacterium]MBI3363898.1 threonylcarbamoyl-AMP synthase [Ignavibacteriota bacterium]